MAPDQSFCPGGTITPIVSASGCTTHWECVTGPTCPNVAAQQPLSCDGGKIVAHFAASGCVTRLECVTCPVYNAPPADFCAPDKTLTTKVDPISGCVSGFECI